MVEALGAVRERTPVAGDVLVIDDNSPDGTGAIADELARDRPWLHVLHRPHKEGLGRAYLAGFRWALERDYAYVLEMDCDFSHDPEAVPSLLGAAIGGADLVLGSRYVTGGGVERLGAQPPRHLGRRLPVRAHDPRRAGARPDGRLQVLPPRGARAHSTSTTSTRRATCSRSR